MIIEPSQKRSIWDYRSIVGRDFVEKLIEEADELRGLCVTHINSTSFGGGVAEILHSLVPLMNSVGLEVKWEVIEAPNEFFNVTKKIHNALQGAEVSLSSSEIGLYMSVNKYNAENVLKIYGDVVVVHDPQPLPIRRYCGNQRVWLWRCHIDLSTPYKPVWNFIRELLQGYHASIYHLKEYIHPETPTPMKFVMPPSIDPLSDKNRELDYNTIHRVLSRYDIDPERPIIVQVARYDPWKDPLGAIDVYRLVKKKIPGVQLLLVASMASDDPEGWVYYEKAVRHAGEDYDIHFLTNLVGVGAVEVNAFQRAATVVLQMSIREGFGLSVAEALWKKKPVVARPSGGIRIQVRDGYNGYLVKGVEEAAEKVIYLIKHPEVRKKLGENGYKVVRENFLITKHLLNYINVFKKVLGGKQHGFL